MGQVFFFTKSLKINIFGYEIIKFKYKTLKSQGHGENQSSKQVLALDHKGWDGQSKLMTVTRKHLF